MANPHDDNTEPTADLGGLATTIRDAREEAGLSIRRLAERVGIHHAGLARIEQGEQRPTLKTVQTIASALELDEADLAALAGYRLPSGLPSLPVYLRTKYRLSNETAAQLEADVQRLAERYGLDEPNGPNKQRSKR